MRKFCAVDRLRVFVVLMFTATTVGACPVNALVPRFDYTSVSPDFAAELRATAVEVRRLAKEATNAVVKIGRMLLAVKNRPEMRGHFMAWVSAECGYSHDTAEDFIRIAKFLAGKSDDLRNLSPTALRLLSRKSTPPAVVSAITKRAETGQPTESEIRALITRVKPKPKIKAKPNPIKAAWDAASDSDRRAFVASCLDALHAILEPQEFQKRDAGGNVVMFRQ